MSPTRPARAAHNPPPGVHVSLARSVPMCETDRESMRRTSVLFLIVLLSMTACGGARHTSAATTTVPPVPPSAVATTTTTSTTSGSATTTVPDPAIIPPTIDAAYVNAVLVQLNHVYGDAQRIEISTKFFPPSVPKLLRAIYADPQWGRQVSIFSSSILMISTVPLKARIGDRATVVTTLAQAGLTCIQAQTTSDYSSIVVTTFPPTPLYLVLRIKDPANDPQHANSTHWAISYEMNVAPGPNDAC